MDQTVQNIYPDVMLEFDPWLLSYHVSSYFPFFFLIYLISQLHVYVSTNTQLRTRK